MSQVNDCRLRVRLSTTVPIRPEYTSRFYGSNAYKYKYHDATRTIDQGQCSYSLTIYSNNPVTLDRLVDAKNIVISGE